MLIVCHLCPAQVALQYGSCQLTGGWGDAAVITPYVAFPVEVVKPYAGSQITKVRIGVMKEASNVYVYIKGKPTDSKPLYRQRVASLSPGWNEITLEEPFAVSGTEAVAVGYKASFAESGGVGYSTEQYSDGDQVYYNSQNKWTGTGYTLCIQAILEGESLPENELVMGKMGSKTAEYEDTTVAFTGTVRNGGKNVVENYTLKYTFDGEEHLIYNKVNLEPNATDTFSLSLPSVVAGLHPLVVNIEKVNGETDFYEANDTVRASLTVRDAAFARRVVCEEMTGTWCGWCPRGMVGLELMKEAHPGKFFAVSVHTSDGMEIDTNSDYNYLPFINKMSGAPSCNVNRMVQGDPYGEIQTLYKLATTSDNILAMSMTAEWNADSTAVEVGCDFWTSTSVPAPQYYAAFTVTEDSITGYGQTNYYAGGENGEMYGWEKKSSPTDDVVFMDVARAILPSYEGVACRTEAMEAGQVYHFDYTVELPSNVNNKRQVNIIAQIIDKSTGYIANASGQKPDAYGTATGITQLGEQQPSRADGAWFDLMGRKIQSPTKGVYIRNGKKILVR